MKNSQNDSLLDKFWTKEVNILVATADSQGAFQEGAIFPRERLKLWSLKTHLGGAWVLMSINEYEYLTIFVENTHKFTHKYYIYSRGQACNRKITDEPEGRICNGF